MLHSCLNAGHRYTSPIIPIFDGEVIDLNTTGNTQMARQIEKWLPDSSRFMASLSRSSSHTSNTLA